MFKVRLHNVLNQTEIDDSLPEEALVINHFPFVIGRDAEASHYALDFFNISRRHCCFYLAGKEIWLKDLESLNGTFLNAKRLVLPRPIKDGDFISIGSCVFRLHVQVPAPERGVIQFC